MGNANTSSHATRAVLSSMLFGMAAGCGVGLSDESELESFGSAESPLTATPLHQNPNLTYDVDNNGVTTSIDSLRIINEIARRNRAGISLILTGHPLTLNPVRYYDVNGDGRITAADAQLVINALARQSRAVWTTSPVSAVRDRFDFDLMKIGSPDPAVILDSQSNIVVNIDGAFRWNFTSRFITSSAEAGLPVDQVRKDTGEIKLAYAVDGNTAEECIASDRLSTSPRASVLSAYATACQAAFVNPGKNAPILVQSQPRFLSVGEQYFVPRANQPRVCIVARTFACVSESDPSPPNFRPAVVRNDTPIGSLSGAGVPTQFQVVNYDTQRYWVKNDASGAPLPSIPAIAEPVATKRITDTPGVQSFDLRPLDPTNPATIVDRAPFAQVASMVSFLRAEYTKYKDYGTGTKTLAPFQDYLSFAGILNRQVADRSQGYLRWLPPAQAGWILQREDVRYATEGKYITNVLLLRSASYARPGWPNTALSFRTFVPVPIQREPTGTGTAAVVAPREPSFASSTCYDNSAPYRSTSSRLFSASALNTSSTSAKSADLALQTQAAELALRNQCVALAAADTRYVNPFAVIERAVADGQAAAGGPLERWYKLRCCVQYTGNARSLTVRAPDGGSVSSSPFLTPDGSTKSLSCSSGKICTVAVAQSVTSIRLTASPQAGQRFKAWTSNQPLGSLALGATLTLDSNTLFRGGPSMELAFSGYTIPTRWRAVGEVWQQNFGTGDRLIRFRSNDSARPNATCSELGGTLGGPLDSYNGVRPNAAQGDTGYFAAAVGACRSASACAATTTDTVVNSSTDHRTRAFCLQPVQPSTADAIAEIEAIVRSHRPQAPYCVNAHDCENFAHDFETTCDAAGQSCGRVSILCSAGAHAINVVCSSGVCCLVEPQTPAIIPGSCFLSNEVPRSEDVPPSSCNIACQASGIGTGDCRVAPPVDADEKRPGQCAAENPNNCSMCLACCGREYADNPPIGSWLDTCQALCEGMSPTDSCGPRSP